MITEPRAAVAGAAIIRAATGADAAAIADIYNHYIRDTIVTFEEEPVSPGEMARRIAEVEAAEYPWLVVEESGHLRGYAYATQWKRRLGYRLSAEITAYLGPDCTGRGLGSALYRELLPLLEARGVHVVIGGIALPNDASVALHEKFGLRKVAHFEQVGIKFGHWIDVGYWQRVL